MSKTNIWGEEEEESSSLVDKKTHHRYRDKDLHIFGENKIALAQEVKKHPTLLEFMAKHPQGEFELLLAEIACYCEVILDDTYTELDIEYLCGILLHKLQEKRGGILYVPSSTTLHLT